MARVTSVPNPNPNPNPHLASPSPYLPIVADSGGREHQKELADKVLRTLPQSCVAKLTHFYIRYDPSASRGLAGKSSVIVSGLVTDEEFVGLLAHEALGHFYDLGCLNGHVQSGKSPFKDGMDTMYNDDPSVAFYGICFETADIRRDRCGKDAFVTGYAPTDPYEFIAETTAYYLLHRSVFEQRAKTNPIIAEELAWMRQYAPTQQELGTDATLWNGVVPWDATKIAYELRIQN